MSTSADLGGILTDLGAEPGDIKALVLFGSGGPPRRRAGRGRRLVDVDST